MKPFAYSRAGDAPTALGLISQPHTKFLAGGTNLVDLMRENIEQPDTVVDISGLPFTQIEELPSGGLSIGATVRNTARGSQACTRALPAAIAGDRVRRLGTDSQHGNGRRQPDAANPLSLLL